MLRSFKLPLIPGYTFDTKIGQRRFPKVQFFESYNGVPMLSEKFNPMHGEKPRTYPSIYPRGESIEMPPWLLFDKQVLRFDAYFQETIQEVRSSSYLIRKCRIFLFLEDGTVQITEPPVNDSGICQGTVVSRHRIRLPEPRSDDFYDIIDFNIGKEVEIYGRMFKIIDCDAFTRNFLNRLGIPVPDPLPVPEDPYIVAREKSKLERQPKKPNTNVDTLAQFLEFDRKILRFWGYWDDNESECGSVHKLVIRYYLADDTIEISEIHCPRPRHEASKAFFRRSRLPKIKDTEYLFLPGDPDRTTVLNVLGPDIRRGRLMLDNLNCGKKDIEYYMDKDLMIGASLNVYGRKILLTDCDEFTKKYYGTKYGVDNFTPLDSPPNPDPLCALPEKPVEREIPPYNGFGDYEDSLGNCFSVIPSPPKKDMVKFIEKDRRGLLSHILRFCAKMISNNPVNKNRIFIISYFLSNDTIKVYEYVPRNSGFIGGKFIDRCKMRKPGQLKFTNRAPVFYTMQDLYIGATVNFNGFKFEILDADEYCFHYMEKNCNQFPVSNVEVILCKLKRALMPGFKEFVKSYLGQDYSMTGIIPYEIFRASLKNLLGGDIVEHEIITLARQFPGVEKGDQLTRDMLRAAAHTEVKKLLYNAFDRLEENCRHQDRNDSGYIPYEAAWAICRGAKLPLDTDLLKAILKRIQKNERGELNWRDLVDFFNYTKFPSPVVQPTAIKFELSKLEKPVSEKVTCVNYLRIFKELGLEEELKQQHG